MGKRIVALMLALLLAFPMASFAAEEKVIFEDSFEGPFKDGIPDKWSKFGSTSTSVDTANVTDGKQSFYILDDSTEAGGGAQSPNFDVKAGMAYTYSVKILVKTGTCSMFVRFYDKDGAQLLNKSISASASDSWTDLVQTLKAPDGAVKTGVVLCVNNKSLGEAYLDEMKIVEGDTSGEVQMEGIGIPPVQTSETGTSKLITPDGANLIYSPYNEEGDTLSDFSKAGFYGGDVELPILENLPVAATIEPSQDPNADDTKRIQEVIDRVAENIPYGTMQVVKLKEGRYNISKDGIAVRSGVVLAGSGQGENGTVLYAKDPVTYTVIRAAGDPPQESGDKYYITDEYVKAGSSQMNLSEEDVKNFAVGDLVKITHPSEKAWSESLGMYGIINTYGDETTWDNGEVDMMTERTITAIDGTTLTFDMPFYVAYTKALSKTYITKIDDITRVKNFGIENLRLESYFDGPNDEKHSNLAIGISNASNGYVRNISAKYFVYAAVRCENNAKQITVQNCSSLEPVSQVAGGRRYSFGCSNSAQQALFTGCYSYDGRHDFSTSYQGTGPIVFCDNMTDKSNAASETHGTWTTGVLYDNLYQVKNNASSFISLTNHGIYGTSLSQGWCAAGCIVWNPLSTAVIGHKPYGTYQNFLIGAWGRYTDTEAQAQKQRASSAYYGIYRTTSQDAAKPENFATTPDTPFIGDCYMELPTMPVEPRSLYKAQLSLRLNGDYRKARPNAPVVVSPRSDIAIGNQEFEVSGIYQVGAEKVTVYVNDKAYEAELDTKTNTFTAKIPLSDVYAKIYATQTINGVESPKNADRFVKVGDVGGMKLLPEHQSIYTPEKTGLLAEDKRETFDQYQQHVSSDIQEITILLRGEKLFSDVKPIMQNDRVLVPMRAIFEGFGAEVTWDEATSTATATAEGRTIQITENESTAYFNGIPLSLDSPALIQDGRFLVPVRFISESFGADVRWIGPTQTVVISGGLDKFEPTQNIPGALTFYQIYQSEPNGGTESICMVDNNKATYCGVNGNDGTAYFQIDLLQIKELSDLYIGFQKGDTRVYEFAVEVSDNGQDFTRVVERTKSTGKSPELEKIPLNGAKGRIVRIVGYGNNENSWNSYNEIVITGK